MKAAYTGWTWLTAKDAETAKKQLEQSFKECKFLGYDYVENFAFISDFLKTRTSSSRWKSAAAWSL